MGAPDPAALERLAAGVLDAAMADRHPGEQVEVMVSTGSSTSVRVHAGEVESFTSAGSAAVGIRVVVEGREGFAHAGSLDHAVLEETLAEARDNAAFGEADEWSGLAEPDGVPPVVASRWSEAVLGWTAEAKVSLALDLERRVVSLDERVARARATTYSDGVGAWALASTAGVLVSDRSAMCSVSTSPMAEHEGETQMGWAVAAGRDPATLVLDDVAVEAVERAVRLLGAVTPASARLPILLDPRLAVTLLGIVADLASGEDVVRGRSLFADRLGEQVASPVLTLIDDPTRAESLAAHTFDGEGLACRPNAIIEGGTLRSFLHNSYTGRRLGVSSTASAVRSTRSLPGAGAQLLVMEPGAAGHEQLIESIDEGVLIFSFSGLHSGVNPVSGDFSVGADGVMIRHGALAEPVRGFTVAGTLPRLLASIREVGSDLTWLPSGHGGCSLVVDGVSISGT